MARIWWSLDQHVVFVGSDDRSLGRALRLLSFVINSRDESQWADRLFASSYSLKASAEADPKIIQLASGGDSLAHGRRFLPLEAVGLM